ncbi:hypothetical protein SKAU_G00162390 [Synaphobranchus kaupii]|uniref:Uncharacterized protein n=1 Tax=Synaphobranchus kaupii TaxID=118154 RepID=A0A9Q1IXT1_SYNKA|nr:hypothetical protein SKAU_G00162390 [Synaphobranchus kaupii]
MQRNKGLQQIEQGNSKRRARVTVIPSGVGLGLQAHFLSQAKGDGGVNLAAPGAPCPLLFLQRNPAGELRLEMHLPLKGKTQFSSFGSHSLPHTHRKGWEHHCSLIDLKRRAPECQKRGSSLRPARASVSFEDSENYDPEPTAGFLRLRGNVNQRDSPSSFSESSCPARTSGRLKTISVIAPSVRPSRKERPCRPLSRASPVFSTLGAACAPLGGCAGLLLISGLNLSFFKEGLAWTARPDMRGCPPALSQHASLRLPGPGIPLLPGPPLAAPSLPSALRAAHPKTQQTPLTQHVPARGPRARQRLRESPNNRGL